MAEQEAEQLAAGVTGGADDGDVHRDGRDRRYAGVGQRRDRLAHATVQRVPHRAEQPGRVAQRVVRRQAEARR